MNKKQLPVLLSSFLLFGSLFAMAAAHAEVAPIGAVATVDIQEVLQRAPQVNTIKEKLKAQFAPRQDKLVTAQKALKADIDTLQQNHAKMDQKSLDSLQKKIEGAQRDLQTGQAALQKDMFAEQDKDLQSLLKQIKEKAAKVAEEKQLSLVLVKNSVVYAKNERDITNDIINLLK